MTLGSVDVSRPGATLCRSCAMSSESLLKVSKSVDKTASLRNSPT